MKLFIAGEESGEKALEFSLRKDPFDSSRIQLMVNLRGEEVSRREHLLSINPNGSVDLSSGVSPRFGLKLKLGKLDLSE